MKYLKELHALQPNIFDKLAGLGGNSRRYVARSPEGLYQKSPHLADPKKKNWKKIGSWFIDLNLSKQQVGKRVREAAREAGLRYGSEVSVKKNLETV